VSEAPSQLPLTFPFVISCVWTMRSSGTVTAETKLNKRSVVSDDLQKTRSWSSGLILICVACYVCPQYVHCVLHLRLSKRPTGNRRSLLKFGPERNFSCLRSHKLCHLLGCSPFAARPASPSHVTWHYTSKKAVNRKKWQNPCHTLSTSGGIAPLIPRGQMEL
jgi:hypothetical protein